MFQKQKLFGVGQTRIYGVGEMILDDRQLVENFINKHKVEQDYYDDIISEDENFLVHYHLSSLRKALFSWYDFKENARILELNAQYGALTEVFCKTGNQVVAITDDIRQADCMKKRYEDCQNLRIQVGNLQDIDKKEQFDYVILYDSNQCDVEFFHQIAKLLKPKGHLLVSYQNSLGMKYLCGMPMQHTNQHFGWLEEWKENATRHYFGRVEIENVLKQSVFKKYQFYYPLPDDRFVQMVYSDYYLPKENLEERIMPYYEHTDTLLCKEKKIYKSVINQGMFPILANSFLVECTMEGTLSDISYVAISADRGKERAYATAIHQTKLVTKYPLYRQGKESVQKLLQNVKELSQREIPMVPHKEVERGVEMPFVEMETLADYIRGAVKRDSNELFRILDKIYEFVLRASEEAEPDTNQMLLRICKVYSEDTEKLEHIKRAEWGPILKKVYLELIPLNCFYDKEREKFLFFDQEFVREYYPAKYVLYRAISICYGFIQGMQQILPIQKVKEHYGMELVWEYYRAEEKLFIDEVRCKDKYKQLYHWIEDTECTTTERNRLKYHSQRNHQRKLIVFGAGKIFDKYYEQCKESDRPTFIVDNDESKWGCKKYSIEIKAPESIFEIPKEKRQILICCKKALEIEEQLKNMGIEEYWKYSDIFD